MALTTALQHVSDRATEFDIIHCHLDWMHLPLLRRLQVPFLTTLHGRSDLPGLTGLVQAFPEAPFVSISQRQQAAQPGANWVGNVYHGMPPDGLSLCHEPGSYLAFLGRMSPEKGAEAAIRIARYAKLPLRISAKVPRDGSRYFREKIEPQLDDQIRFVGEVNDAQKQEFLGEAIALLFPIDWPEPFGLVMIEAMACGTPVVAFRRGSVPEVIEPGVSGFIVDNEIEAVAALSKITTLNRGRVRETFERRFTTRRMTNDYLSIYQRLVEESKRECADARAVA